MLRHVTLIRRFLQEPHNVTSQKTPFFIVTALQTSNLTCRMSSAGMWVNVGLVKTDKFHFFHGFFYPEDVGDNILQNIGFYKTHKMMHRRRWHSSKGAVSPMMMMMMVMMNIFERWKLAWFVCLCWRLKSEWINGCDEFKKSNSCLWYCTIASCCTSLISARHRFEPLTYKTPIGKSFKGSFLFKFFL
jgi:hypothetical protein